jgi:YHS domain-containing protein
MTRRCTLICHALSTRAVLATLILAAPAAAQDNAPPAPAAQAPAAQAPAAPAAQDPQLNGYCPASYLLTGKAVKGSPEFKVTHKDKVYYAASAEAKKALESEPDRYLPQFGGLCTTRPCSMSITGRSTCSSRSGP